MIRRIVQEQQLTLQNQNLKVKDLKDEMKIEKSKVKNLEEKMVALEAPLNKILEQKKNDPLSISTLPHPPLLPLIFTRKNCVPGRI